MSDQLIAVAISSGVSLLGAFGSILLKDQLDRRRHSTDPGVRDGETSGTSGAAAERGPPAPGPLMKAAMAALYAGIGLAIGNYEFDLGQAVLIIFLPPLLILWFYGRKGTRSLAGYQVTILAYWAGVLGGQVLRRLGRGFTGVNDDQIMVALGWWAAWALLGLVVIAIARGRGARA